MILIDTNVISEVLKPAPAPEVVSWLNVHFPNAAISIIAVFELMAGVALLERGRRRDALESAVEQAIQRFGVRVYSYNAAAAAASAQLLEHARRQGLALHQIPA